MECFSSGSTGSNTNSSQACVPENHEFVLGTKKGTCRHAFVPLGSCCARIAFIPVELCKSTCEYDSEDPDEKIVTKTRKVMWHFLAEKIMWSIYQMNTMPQIGMPVAYFDIEGYEAVKNITEITETTWSRSIFGIFIDCQTASSGTAHCINP